MILLTGFDRADGIASLFVAAVMLRAAWGLLRDSGRIFLEAAPKGIDVAEVGSAMIAVDGVTEVHDLHVWEVTSGFPALSAHVLVGADDDCHRARVQLETMLHDRFGIEHTTLQVDHEGGDLLSIEVRAAVSPGYWAPCAPLPGLACLLVRRTRGRRAAARGHHADRRRRRRLDRDPGLGVADVGGPAAGHAAPLGCARRRADDAAATQGLRITGVRSVVLAPAEITFGATTRRRVGGRGRLGAGEADEPTRVSPGTQQFTERVRVVYTATPVYCGTGRNCAG